MITQTKKFLEIKDELVSEFIGTFLIVFLTCFSDMWIFDSFIDGGVTFFVYSFCIYSSYKFSKSHFNPAVTFGYFTMGEIKFVKAILYIITQLLASVAAGAIASFFSKLNQLKTNGAPWVYSHDQKIEHEIITGYQGSNTISISLDYRDPQFYILDVHYHEKCLGQTGASEYLWFCNWWVLHGY